MRLEYAKAKNIQKFSHVGNEKTTSNDSIARINSLLDEIIGEQISENTFNKLTYLTDIKKKISDAIQEKGQTIESCDPFVSYAERIIAIESKSPPGNPEGYAMSISNFYIESMQDKSMNVTFKEVTE